MRESRYVGLVLFRRPTKAATGPQRVSQSSALGGAVNMVVLTSIIWRHPYFQQQLTLLLMLSAGGRAKCDGPMLSNDFDLSFAPYS